jgi:hypothetical protein
MKTKNLKSEIKDVNDKGVVTIAIARFDVEDSDGDITRKGAFERTFKEGKDRIKHYLDHKMLQAFNVGLPVKMFEDTNYAVVESALNLEKQISRDLFSDYKFFKEHGKSLEHSFGYKTLKGKSRGRGEEILELFMPEYSTVGYAAMGDTPLLGMKSFEDVTIQDLEAYLRKFDVSKTKGAQIESIISKIKELQETHTPDGSGTHNPVKSLNELLKTKKIY